ncbi:MAG: radical SAM protein [Candidatus Auribacterota bacterium]
MKKMPDFPLYLKLSPDEWQSRIDRGFALLEDCTACPNRCGVNRVQGKHALCRSGFFMKVSSAFDHRGEEPVISGTNGSGTIFFSGCTMKCIYCQNYPISQQNIGTEIPFETVTGYMLDLQKRGVHNINLVTPTHFMPQILIALKQAVEQGLHIPIVYNTSGYETPEALALLDGIVDIYLPDMRYANNETARKYSGVNQYVEFNRNAIKIMAEQVGELVCDNSMIAQRGLIVRMLILPGLLDELESNIRFLAAELPCEPHISLMSQYFPTWHAIEDPLLKRKISYEEYEQAVGFLEKYDLNKGWVQDF